MARSITLVLGDEHELLWQAISAYAQCDMFVDEQGDSLRLAPEQVAVHMLTEGCLQWVQDVPGLPPELEQRIREEFDLADEDECESCDDEGCGECDDDHSHDSPGSTSLN